MRRVEAWSDWDDAAQLAAVGVPLDGVDDLDSDFGVVEAEPAELARNSSPDRGAIDGACCHHVDVRAGLGLVDLVVGDLGIGRKSRSASAVATILVGLGSIVTWCDEAGDLRERLWSEH